jgi:hypothetical protein
MKISPFTLLVSLLFLNTLILRGQALQPEVKGSTSLMLQLWGPEVLGIHLNHNISPRISLNLGVGLLLDAHLGANYYFTNRSHRKSSFYAGAQLAYIHEYLFDFWNSRSAATQLEVYLPIGYEYLGRRGFTFQADLGPNFVNEDWDQSNSLPFYGSIKVGISLFRKI